jgi:hypothetical protein
LMSLWYFDFPRTPSEGNFVGTFANLYLASF